MLTKDEKIILVDFSIARVDQFPDISQRHDGSFGYVGTPNYSAPEQIQTPDQIGNKVDIFAMGVILYELFTGELPFEYGNIPVFYTDGHLPAPKQQGIPNPIYELVCSTLSDSVYKRPTATEIYFKLLLCCKDGIN